MILLSDKLTDILDEAEELREVLEQTIHDNSEEVPSDDDDESEESEYSEESEQSGQSEESEESEDDEIEQEVVSCWHCSCRGRKN